MLVVMAVMNTADFQAAAQSEPSAGARPALDLIPDDAQGLAAVDVSAAPSLLPMLPAEMLTGPGSAVVGALNGVMTHRFGISVQDVQTLALFTGSGEQSWGLVCMGAFTGEAFVPVTEVHGSHTIYGQEPAPDSPVQPLYFAASTGWFVLGSLQAVQAVLDVSDGARDSYAASPIVGELLEGGDPVLSALVFASGAYADSTLQRYSPSFPSGIRGLSMAIGRYRTRWSFAYDSPEQAAEANDALDAMLNHADDLAHALETDALTAETFGEELVQRLGATLVTTTLAERMRHERTDRVAHLEMLGPPSLTLTTALLTQIPIRTQTDVDLPNGPSIEPE